MGRIWVPGPIVLFNISETKLKPRLKKTQLQGTVQNLSTSKSCPTSKPSFVEGVEVPASRVRRYGNRNSSSIRDVDQLLLSLTSIDPWPDDSGNPGMPRWISTFRCVPEKMNRNKFGNCGTFFFRNLKRHFWCGCCCVVVAIVLMWMSKWVTFRSNTWKEEFSFE